ncbi:LruC domain-containing protein [Mucilaginibacter galii]|uniref:LruC domain-containing protein n=2 Tax=Mucilaginibacter galii TaxID=2005073 RepID=A0A917JEL0_9SPHI|nr:LruC domain-containing protein [Mucilaginibacter galii]
MVGVVIVSACKKEVLTQDTPVPEEVAKVIDVPAAPFVPGFNYNTTRDVQLNIVLRANNDAPLAGVVVSVYLPNAAGEAVFKGVTDKNGMLKGKLTLAGSIDQVVIDPAYIGLMRNALASISTSNTVNAIIGGVNGYGGDVVAESVVPQSVASSSHQTNALLATSYAYPTGYTASNSFVNTATYPKALGRPVYLDATSDVLDASLLSYINASLPENQPLTTTHPAYFASTAASTLTVTAKTDVYVTFVSEGASNMNTLAYYTYPTNDPPLVGESLLPVLGGIGNITYVFPNASAVGSAGGLKTGDRVKIGNFSAGTSIGFVLIQNGWNGSGVTTSGKTKFYSGDNMNASKKKQAVLLYDDVHKKFISSFEDIDRSLTTTDNDFNDLVFYTTSSVADAISTTNVATIDRGGDTDGDGVQDAQDMFPNDGTRAFVTYYPSATATGTIAFEDHWPSMGDYDMNDLVVSYKYAYEVNAQNQVVNLKAYYTVLAAGTGYKHGFGVELPVPASVIKSVTGQSFMSNYITMAANGVEAGQAKAVIIPFDNYAAMMPGAGSATLINTMNTQSKMASQTASLTIAFNSPVTMASLAVSSFNPFLIANLERGREVHLMGYKPTNKADIKLFDTADDATVPARNKYYVSVENKPFALIFNSSFSYPTEKTSIDKAYKQYNTWAFSNGGTYADWYSNIASSYRNPIYIYNK